ncbi:hypothetical protein IWW39_003338 [Coemansia spiralis]|uniref:Uncharacterized protein n=1 Tax=Coemansia spiralis TaxID=417178 RepID=A0A9W8L4E0_9FUNG|nr:hypothetical protein IWW39_003338 [Coemansia spiralis]
MATQPGDGGDERVLGPSLIRCRQWLLPRRRTSTGSGASTYTGVAGCPDRYENAYGSSGLGVCPERFDGQVAGAGVLSTASSNRSLGSRRAARYHYYCAQQQGTRTASYSSASLDSGAAARLAQTASASTVFSGPDTHIHTRPLPPLLDDNDSPPDTAVAYDDAPYVAPFTPEASASDDEYEVIRLQRQLRRGGRNRHHTISGGEAQQYVSHYAHSLADSVASAAEVNGVAPGPSEAPGPAMPSAAAIAQIFLVGQPPPGVGPRGVSRARRASQWLQSIGRPRASTLELADAVVAVFAAEAGLAASVRVLEKTRSTQSAAFRGRADRVHLAQARVLGAVHRLFLGLVPDDEHRSRHYRFYLPEEDQAELDRGFSESVLFAAQALARGFQIRGTETRTLALRDPAALLCAAWAAVRHVLQERGRELWKQWSAGSVTDADTHALRRVLADFDDAWVRFERDLCFAYFGLADTNLASDDDTDTGPGLAQEEEFSLLVVLLSETLQRCLTLSLVSKDQVDDMDPQVILALPRLAILHAIAHAHPTDGLCFVQSDHAPIFWWFREFAHHCARISAALAEIPPPLYTVLLRMLVAEEADVILADAKPVLIDIILAQQAETIPPPSPVTTAATATVAATSTGARRMTMDDLESIIDSPRSARSMSIDCISSICASDPPAYTSPSPVCSCCLPSCQAMLDSERLAARLVYAVDLLVSPPLAMPSPRSLPPKCCPQQHHQQQQQAVAKEAELASKLSASHATMKQIYVDLCTVADSLHSGPFARPFRVALELVFRMNLADD